MKIVKFIEFIKEELSETPEQYVSTALMQLKKKIDKMFEDSESEGNFIKDEEEPGKKQTDLSNQSKVQQKQKTISQAKLDSKKKEGMTFKDLGVKLESSEVSKYSKMYDSLTVKFSDDLSFYTLIIIIELGEGLPKDPKKDFEPDDIEKCYIKFKKYDVDTFDIVGQIAKNVKIKKIDEEFLIDLKIELDDKFGDEEEFEIETEK